MCLCEQQMLGRVCAYAQTRPRIRCSPIYVKFSVGMSHVSYDSQEKLDGVRGHRGSVIHGPPRRE